MVKRLKWKSLQSHISHFCDSQGTSCAQVGGARRTTRRIGRLDWAGTGKLGHAALLGTMQS